MKSWSGYQILPAQEETIHPLIHSPSITKLFISHLVTDEFICILLRRIVVHGVRSKQITRLRLHYILGATMNTEHCHNCRKRSAVISADERINETIGCNFSEKRKMWGVRCGEQLVLICIDAEGRWRLMLWCSSLPTCDFRPAAKKFSVHLFKKSYTPAWLADDLLPRPYFQLQQYSIHTQTRGGGSLLRYQNPRGSEAKGLISILKYLQICRF
jgi:hypothetical protein